MLEELSFMGCNQRASLLSAVTMEIHGEEQQNVFNNVAGLAWPKSLDMQHGIKGMSL